MGMHIARTSDDKAVRRARWVKLAAVAIGFTAGVAGLARNAHAVIIVAGQAATPTGSGTFSGTLLNDTGAENFVGTGVGGGIVFLGTFDSQVYKDSTTGDLDFVYQISNNLTSIDSIESLTSGGFAPFTTDADYVPATGVAIPTTVTRNGSGNNVGFDFTGVAAIAPGTTTDLLVVKTDASSYTTGFAVVQDGGNGSAAEFVPAVPEPTTAALAGLATMGLAIRRRRSNRTR